MDRFCSAVSHDLKSPLGVMRMLLSALREEMGSSLEGEAARIVTMLDNKAGELTTMVSRLLEFSRMCNIKPSFEILDLAAAVRVCFHEQQLAEPDRRVVLRCGALPPVRGDAVLIRMMLKNIISNAFKFTRTREEAVIEVRASEEDGFTAASAVALRHGKAPRPLLMGAAGAAVFAAQMMNFSIAGT
ncbi:MAG TPA: HAMP domain-containing histidine kinase, partial [Candidatus Agathobaculum merdipullorum]|nr:HAMP domain-containing histidine kinase [Candidatus Agathobaculum merdipullorum]